ncbi:MAG: transcriptional regulator MntR [Verrucomicrobiota bacterium]|nr:transcriptional regulator MntR [Verrucomicrobiota bacterium]
MPTSRQLSISVEDYLERIYELITEKGYARTIDIASSLHIAQASVTKMVQKLDEDGFVIYEKYRGLVLSPEGERVAKAIKRRHQVLAEFFGQLNLEAANVEKDIEGIEHHLSPSTIDSIENLVGFFKENPDQLKKLNQFKNKK